MGQNAQYKLKSLSLFTNFTKRVKNESSFIFAQNARKLKNIHGIIRDYLYFWDANFELDILSEIDLDAIADAEADADDDDDAYDDAGDGEAVPEDNASCWKT